MEPNPESQSAIFLKDIWGLMRHLTPLVSLR